MRSYACRREVLKLLAKGETEAEVARRVGIGVVRVYEYAEAEQRRRAKINRHRKPPVPEIVVAQIRAAWIAETEIIAPGVVARPRFGDLATRFKIDATTVRDIVRGLGKYAEAST